MKKIFCLYKYCYPLILIIIFLSCSDESVNEPPPPYVYEIPEVTDDGWETSSLSNVGIDEERLVELVDLVNYRFFKNVHSILIVKDGTLVFEEYFEGHTFDYNGNNHQGLIKDFDKNTVHNQASVTKSFTSALIGIAVDQGEISIEDKVFSFFPEYSELKKGDKQNLNITHLLTMSAGFDWNEHDVLYGDIRNDVIQMWQVNDPLEYLVLKPLVHTPGSQFYYNSGCTNLLGEIIYRATSMKPDVFADQYLFNKLGIKDRSWERFSNGVVFVSGDLRIRPRDMAKLGYLYLNNGVWNGEQVISSDWIQKSTSNHIKPNDTWSYGYQWWLRNYNANGKSLWSYSARGWGGQVIAVFPELDMVLVFTGGNYVDPEPVDQIIIEFILPSIL